MPHFIEIILALEQWVRYFYFSSFLQKLMFNNFFLLFFFFWVFTTVQECIQILYAYYHLARVMFIYATNGTNQSYVKTFLT